MIQLTGGFSLVAGDAYPRDGYLGSPARIPLGAIGALFSIGGRYPWWSLAVFLVH